MITKIKCGFRGARRSYVSPVDFGLDDRMINAQQKRSLISAIYEYIEDEDERETLLSQIDDMTADEANEMLFQIRK